MTTSGTDAAPYSPLITIDGGEYFPDPYSAPSLSPAKRYSMVPIASLASLSTISTLVLIIFILCRMVGWRGHYRTWLGYNQYVVLALNLLLADLQQSSAFLISWHWFRVEHILAPSAPCFAQGWLLHSGDVSSGFFVLSIALHTYYTAVHGRRVGDKTFMALVAGIWLWAYFLTAIGVWMHGRDRYFTAAGSWCWVSEAFEIDRLWCHYVWIFMIQFSTILIYLATFFSLRSRTKRLMSGGETSSQNLAGTTIRAVNRIAVLMMLYPFAYVVLTLPLSAGRMWTMSHGARATSDIYTCIAGSLLTSCGWIDSLLYTLTRKRLLHDAMPGTATFGTANSGWSSKNVGQPRSPGMTRAAVDLPVLNTEVRRRHETIGSQPSNATFSTRSSSRRDSIDNLLIGRSIYRGWSWRAKRGTSLCAEPEHGQLIVPPPPAYTDSRPNRTYWEDRLGSPTQGV